MFCCSNKPSNTFHRPNYKCHDCIRFHLTTGIYNVDNISTKKGKTSASFTARNCLQAPLGASHGTTQYKVSTSVRDLKKHKSNVAVCCVCTGCALKSKPCRGEYPMMNEFTPLLQQNGGCQTGKLENETAVVISVNKDGN